MTTGLDSGLRRAAMGILSRLFQQPLIKCAGHLFLLIRSGKSVFYPILLQTRNGRSIRGVEEIEIL